ncbi:hypothetical protein RND81_09G237000 [Saponaria officinalis]|uniref:Uncharacterized protein n=1 Tax=Saponaria officinalis TaxID=3572 RepID=A0AAW1IQC5_SAPOF
MDEWRKMRGGQIPAFGNWEHVDEMPITQYFECARQAGLIRYSSSSGECACDRSSDYNYNYNYNDVAVAPPDLYSVHYVKPLTVPRSSQRKKREKRREKEEKEGSRKQGGGKVYDVRVREKKEEYQYDAVLELGAQTCRPPKAVDEDLYHIPPELLKRKRRLGFFSRCLVPPCAV